ncbi:glycosyltransferase family 4 protein [Pedobacter helvus]|uniref:Glycosyltransferase family 4 protein n=1 Tax=Pedobacter helvus TaxID=2563444 RepID=A0ABW9JDN7_9SPHI|nr:glycosyltransferase family 1 protein [Pedobacter ureilyticus]
MIRVGFLLNFPVEYKGGINYLKNLFYAVHKFHSEEIKIVLFVPDDLEQEYILMFCDYAEIIKTKIIQRKSLAWFVSKVGQKALNYDLLTNSLLHRHRINVISHSNYVYPGNKIKTINWIPDFQRLHYPHLWNKKQLKSEQKLHQGWVEKSDRIVVSSYDALKDLASLYPEYQKNTKVLHFVSQPDILKYQEERDISKYTNGKYYYLPNQFWEHKNHLVVFKAVKILKDRGINIVVLTSGLMNDFRNNDNHVNKLRAYVNDNQLDQNIRFLGLIPYLDVLQLIKSSLAVINPSFFEGWSSTVEESKSIGKKIILSNIEVHKEQCPKFGFYFDPTNEIELAFILENLWNAEQNEPEETKEELLRLLDINTKSFSDNYRSIIFELF